jgi:NAD(P)-dependent dehydrogenase (short-subunit alcohol dehydrogenase family)
MASGSRCFASTASPWMVISETLVPFRIGQTWRAGRRQSTVAALSAERDGPARRRVRHRTRGADAGQPGCRVAFFLSVCGRPAKFSEIQYVRTIPRHFGSITNISSISGMVGQLDAPGYQAAKAGVRLLTKNAAVTDATRGIRGNAIVPGGIQDEGRTPPTAEGVFPRRKLQGKLKARGNKPASRPAAPGRRQAPLRPFSRRITCNIFCVFDTGSAGSKLPLIVT